MKEKLTLGEGEIQKKKERRDGVKRSFVEKGKDTLELKKKREREAAQKLEEARKIVTELKRKARGSEISKEERLRLMKGYQEQYLPEYLKRQKGKSPVVALMSAIFTIKELLGRFAVKGRERIPSSGPYLVVSNHFGGETGKLLHVFGKDKVHIMAGSESNWKRSGFRNKLLQNMGMLPIDESLAHLSAQEKQALLDRTPQRSRGAYERIIQREDSGRMPLNTENIRAAVAALLKGEPVAIFPEGLFTYDGKKQLRKAYPGLELICAEYKRITGHDLPIVPTAVRKNEVLIGKPVLLSEDTKQKQGTDSVMKQLAGLLPEHERGVYAT
ncbi:MAG: lysophospholipid acyltransferase family protein [bacterium]|nr:lysophospholipid acyltransferase family protein [bacterium]